ncbi:GNAT family N-acetyltransferase [Niabella drilacis]|uniref:Ribosomal protein S18 acetylase RimI n=1 Tax=Niabella drilacis (strain DSM 25811 / CCM 8410 / CCUG 62505 / LMG 26954 / E90) TaxID=1285928 RepID=A0A1G7AD85_NIADE|nr:GNAT family N-acetyltransferase [Niabella drilacis]SDE12437.1 Ribosomal protein S18 acetylase RimI [Niabella drilacis]
MTTALEKNLILKKARTKDAGMIWQLLLQAIEKRRQEGSTQWQDGYPNPAVVARDIERGYGYVCMDETGSTVAYAALIFDGEPAYEALEGQWLTNQPYAVIHRLAVNQEVIIKGLGTWVMAAAEELCRQQGTGSIRIDTNFDNTAMLQILEKLGYTYCGEVYFRGAARRAFEKRLDV